MRRLMFLLSGEHPSLPTAEVLAAIKAERRAYRRDEELDQVLMLETKAAPGVLAERLAMTHWIGRHLCTSTTDEILAAMGSSDIVNLIPHGKSFAVRIKRVKRYSTGISPAELAKKIADLVRSEVDFKVDLTAPDVEIFGVLTEGKCALGLTEARVDRRQFERRRPKHRAAFHPGTLMPTLARCMVNLAQTPRGGTLLDPFCGVGGILIEAGLIGARPVGADIEPKLLEGAEKNLGQAGVTSYELSAGDARELEVGEKVDAVATDPPYGRQATTGGSELRKLYERALPKLAEALKPRRYMCITAPAGLELEEIAEDAGFKLMERHEQRVHKSLTRNVYVFRRE
jgi:tRNA (guanine10-N2)-dimethyltransferase